jgi:hypothetical protein
MGLKSPLGLIIISEDGKTKKLGLFRFYQNAVDYLSVYSQSREWTKVEDNKFRSKAGFVVEAVMVVPDGIDLTQETYLDQEGHNAQERSS